MMNWIELVLFAAQKRTCCPPKPTASCRESSHRPRSRSSGTPSTFHTWSAPRKVLNLRHGRTKLANGTVLKLWNTNTIISWSRRLKIQRTTSFEYFSHNICYNTLTPTVIPTFRALLTEALSGRKLSDFAPFTHEVVVAGTSPGLAWRLQRVEHSIISSGRGSHKGIYNTAKHEEHVQYKSVRHQAKSQDMNLRPLNLLG